MEEARRIMGSARAGAAQFSATSREGARHFTAKTRGSRKVLRSATVHVKLQAVLGAKQTKRYVAKRKTDRLQTEVADRLDKQIKIRL